MINKLINERKERLNKISAPYVLAEIIHDPMWFILGKADKDIRKAVEDNEATDRFLRKWGEKYGL